MIGDVGVLVIFVDDAEASWAREEINKALEDVNYALNWWHEQASMNNVPLNFKLTYIPHPIRTHYSVSKMTPNQHYLWVSEILREMGYTTENNPEYNARIIISEMRKKLGVDWGFLIFMVKDPNWNNFGGEALGYGLYGGPYLMVTWKPSEILPGVSVEIPFLDVDVLKLNEKTIAHEIGHIFYATDEYDDKPESSGYFNEYENEDSGCIMDTPVDLIKIKDLILLLKQRLGFWCVSEGTKRQIGWVDDNKNGIPDLLEVETELEVKGFKPLTDDNPLKFIGEIRLKPPPNRNPYGTGRDVTIVKIKQVSVTIHYKEQEKTFLMGAVDGVFDSPQEYVNFVIPFLGAGEHQIEVNVENNFGLFKTKVSLFTTYTYIKVDEALSLPKRVDVGSPQKIGFHAVWAHNNEPITGGILYINDKPALPDGNGWFYIIDSSDIVGEIEYSVTSGKMEVKIEEKGQHYEEEINKLEITTSPIKLVYDRVVVNLNCEDTRINTQDNPIIKYDAFYEYDKTPFEGEILLEPEPKALGHVGAVRYSVSKIHDFKYGLTSFRSNEVEVIYDKVIVDLSVESYRVQAGKTATLNVVAVYDYDKTPFKGIIYMDGYEMSLRGELATKVEIPPEDRLVSKSLRVLGIRDLEYGITEFTSQPIEIRFDKLKYNWKLEPTLFGALVDVEIWYESDNSPVKDATVLVNGQQIPLVAHNRYSAQIPMLGLEETIKLQIEKGGFDTIYDMQVIYNQSNLMFYSFVSVFGIIIITAIIIRSRYRRRVIAPPPPKPTLLEPSKLKLEETNYENIFEYIERMEKYVAELNDLRAQGIIDEQTYEIIKSGLMTKIMNLSNRLKEDVFRLNQEIAVRQKKLKILAERYSKGVLSETSYLEISGKLINEIKQLNNELAQKQDILQRLERLGK
jgi:Asp-tRNA(Asn)/Glu-tRNA(Gln) amidotransferase C subunit